MKFSYSDETEIVGADKGAAGSCDGPAQSVTVTYHEHGTANVAIED